MLRIDKLQLDLIVNGDEGRKELLRLQKEAADLRKEMKGIKDQDLLGKKQQELNQLENKMESIRQEIGITGMTMKELSQRSSQLNAVLRNIAPNHAEFKAYQNELRAVNERMYELKNGSKVARQSLLETSGSKFSLAGMVAGGMAAYNTVVSVFNGIKNGIVSSIEAYREQEIAIQKVEQAIKQTGGAAGLSLKQLTDEATRLQNNTLFGDEDILNNATAQLLTFTNITGENFLKAQKSAMDLSTVLDGDLQASSIRLGKALNDPVNGLSALRKAGVAFTDDQRKMIKELAETNRLEEAQAIILQEVNHQYGGQAEAVAKGSGAMQQAGIQLGEVAESIGGFIARLITPFVSIIGQLAKSFNELLAPSQTALETFQEHGRSVAILVKDIDPLLDRYDQLKSKTMLNAIEQGELKKIIGQVAAVMPGAATAFDQYGNAINISTQRVRDYIKGQVLLLRYENRKAIDETISDLSNVNVAIEREKSRMNQIAKTGTFPVFEPKSTAGAKTGGTSDDIRNATQAEIAVAQRGYQELVNTQIALNTKLSQLRGDALQQSLNSYEVETKYAKSAADDLTAYKTMSAEELKDIAEDGNDTEKKLAKEEIDRRNALKKSAKEYTEYIKNITRQLEDAKAQLIQNEKEKELAILKIEHERQLVTIKGNSDTENELRKVLGDKYKLDKENIEKKFNEKAIQESWNVEKAKFEARIKATTEGAPQWYRLVVEFLEKEKAFELSNTELTEQQKLDIIQKYDEKRIELENNLKKFKTKDVQQVWQTEKEKLEARIRGVKEGSAIWYTYMNELLEKEKAFELSNAELTEQQKLDIIQKYAEKRSQAGSVVLKTGANNLDDLQLGQKMALLKKVRDAELANAQGSADDQKRIWEEFHAGQLEAITRFVNAGAAILQTVVSALSGVNQAMTEYENAQLAKDEVVNNTKKENLKKQLDSKLITQQQYDQGITKLDAEMDAKKKKLAIEQAKRQKALALAQAIINVAQAITSALSAGPIIGIILAALVGVLGAIQIAYIASTPIPEAAKGRYGALMRARQAANGKYNVIGKDDGKLYKDVPYEKSFTGIPGRPLLINETGNEIVIDPYTTKNLIMNYPEIIYGINQARVPQRASGAYEAIDNGRSENESVVGIKNTIDRLNENLKNGTQLNKQLNDILEKGLQAYISFEYLRETTNKVNKIEASISK